MTFSAYLKKERPSLAWPDPFPAAAYRLEIISATLQGSRIVHESKKNLQSPVVGECKLGSRDPLIEKHKGQALEDLWG